MTDPNPAHRPAPLATVVIATKNRKEDVRRALESLRDHEGVPDGRVEVIVVDDGSTDGTADVVRDQYPWSRLHRFETSQGVIGARNTGTQLARAPIVITIDDDCTFPFPGTVLQTLKDFDDDRVGAVAIPMEEPKLVPGKVMGRPPEPDGIWVTWSYTGGAAAVRREHFLGLGGYWKPLVHYKEEPDFCVRLLHSGYVVRLGRADVIHHHFTPTSRSNAKHRYQEARATVMFAMHNVPMPYLLVHLAAVAAREVVMWKRKGHILKGVKGTLVGYIDGVKNWKDRGPISRGAYRAIIAIKRRGTPAAWPGLHIDEIERIISSGSGAKVLGPSAARAASSPT